MPKILYTSQEISDTIRALFSSSHIRRVIIAAFVGVGTERYLPNPRGIELICWPKPDSTSPNAIRALINLGVEVFFVDNLHMKVYWAKDQGAVITSANLSTNAFSGRLKEIGVLLSTTEFTELDVNRILQSLDRRPVSEEEFREFERLHTQIERLRKLKLPGTQVLGHLPDDVTPPAYKDWYEGFSRKPWKLATFIPDKVPLSKKTKEILRAYDREDPQMCVSTNSPELGDGDWVLFFDEKTVKDPFWFYVDHLVPVSPEEPAYHKGSYQIIQVGPNEITELPFQLSERFLTKVDKAIAQFGGAKWLNSLKSAEPPEDFLALLYDLYC